LRRRRSADRRSSARTIERPRAWTPNGRAAEGRTSVRWEAPVSLCRVAQPVSERNRHRGSGHRRKVRGIAGALALLATSIACAGVAANAGTTITGVTTFGSVGAEQTFVVPEG